VTDRDSTRLKLSADDAVKIELAKFYKDTTRPPGVPATPAQWTEMRPLGKFYIANAVEKVKQAHKVAELNAKKSAATGEEAIERAKQVMDLINAKIADARESDPANASDYVYYLEGRNLRLSGGSTENWKKRTDVALKNWADVKEGVKTLNGLIDDAKQLKVKVPMNGMDPEAIDRNADNEIRRLTEHRTDRRGNRG
jgi:hypothetical protein